MVEHPKKTGLEDDQDVEERGKRQDSFVGGLPIFEVVGQDDSSWVSGITQDAFFKNLNAELQETPKESKPRVATRLPPVTRLDNVRARSRSRETRSNARSQQASKAKLKEHQQQSAVSGSQSKRTQSPAPMKYNTRRQRIRTQVHEKPQRREQPKRATRQREQNNNKHLSAIQTIKSEPRHENRREKLEASAAAAAAAKTTEPKTARSRARSRSPRRPRQQKQLSPKPSRQAAEQQQQEEPNQQQNTPQQNSQVRPSKTGANKKANATSGHRSYNTHTSQSNAVTYATHSLSSENSEDSKSKHHDMMTRVMNPRYIHKRATNEKQQQQEEHDDDSIHISEFDAQSDSIHISDFGAQSDRPDLMGLSRHSPAGPYDGGGINDFSICMNTQLDDRNRLGTRKPPTKVRGILAPALEENGSEEDSLEEFEDEPEIMAVKAKNNNNKKAVSRAEEEMAVGNNNKDATITAKNSKRDQMKRVSYHESVRDNICLSEPRLYSSQKSLSRKRNWDENSSNSSQRIDFLKDDPSEMTYGRQIALYLMKRFTWYNPQLKVELERKRRISERKSLRKSVSKNFSKSFRGGNALKDDDDDEEEDIDSHHYRSNDGYIRTHSAREEVSLAQAWAHFEHYTLARYIVEDEQGEKERTKSIWKRIVHRFQKADLTLERACRGENMLPTKLYHWLWTPHTQLGDFGIGWGLYFASLRFFSVIMFLAGILNITNFIFFSSTDYGAGQESLPFLLQGSAICNETVWVPCPNCSETCKALNMFRHEHRLIQQERLAYAYYPQYDLNMTFALRNLCHGANTRAQGLVNYGSLILFLFGLVLFNRYVQIMEIYFDEDEQTTQDYSIQIENPPPDATDPEEWRQFFKDAFNAHVTLCTVAVNNDTLIKKLVERRETLRKIERSVEEGTPMDTTSLAAMVARVERERSYFSNLLSFFVPGIPELFRNVVVLTTDIRGLAQQEYPASRVFVTFEKEGDQRQVLSDMAIGSLHVWRNNHSRVKDPKHLFRGEHILDISESDEPDTMRWNHLNESELKKMGQLILTGIVTVIAVICAGLVIEYMRGVNMYASAFAISGFNISFPYCAKYFTRFEGHRTETELQTSMYFKIVLFRWVNTAVVYTAIYPFTATLEPNDGLIDAVYSLFFSEIITLNVIQLTDAYGNFLRHVVAPRARTQDEMNICFRGLEVELAERYTNMTKIVFLACWYSSIYPCGFFMSSMALFVNYYTDRHSLMRTWYRAPHLGPQISEFSRKYFLTMCFMAMAILSSYYWAGFPFDNLCENDDLADEYVGTDITIEFPYDSPDRNKTITISANDHSYRFCNQDFFQLNYKGLIFPFFPSAQPEGDEWMTPEQELLATLYGWTVIFVVGFVCICFLQALCDSLMKMLYGDADAVGQDMGIDFSTGAKVVGYVPQVRSCVYPYPLIVGTIDSSSISYGVIDWTDPTRPHSYYDLTKDAEKILRDIDHSKVFSRLKHWPAPLN